MPKLRPGAAKNINKINIKKKKKKNHKDLGEKD